MAGDIDLPLSDVLPDNMLNKINRELKAQIVVLEQEQRRKAQEVADNAARLKLMSEHLTNVRAEIKGTQELCEAKKREVETEDHMTRLAERALGSVQAELKDAALARRELTDRVDAVQTALFQGNLRMDEFKAHMNFNHEELEQWDLARKQKEEDASALQRYHKVDEARFKELSLQLTKLTQAVHAKKKELEREVTETQAAQLELERAAEDFRALHRDRQDLIQQWEEAIQTMHLRDAAIQAAGAQFADGKEWHERRAEQLQETTRALAAEKQKTKELEGRLAQAERSLGFHRTSQMEAAARLKDVEGELEVMKNAMVKAATELSQRQALKASLLQQVSSRQDTLTKLQTKSDRTATRLTAAAAVASDLEGQRKFAADMLAETEQTMAQLEKEMALLKGEQFMRVEELSAARRAEGDVVAAITGAQSQNRNMAARIHQLDQEAFRQQELLYAIEFQVQRMERRVSRAKGERTEEEKRELKAKIATVQATLEEVQRQRKGLETQAKHVGDDLRQCRMSVEQKSTEKSRHDTAILELRLQTESCEQEQQRLARNRQTLLVNHDVLRLQVARLDKTLASRGKGLFDLETRREQLQSTIEEREAEISAHRDGLRLQIKATEEERRRVLVELRERQSQIGHLKSRFQVLINRVPLDEDDPTGDLATAHYIVKTAQEREELQAAGDALDEEIRRMETEARKLDRTLEALKGCNSTFKEQFKRTAKGDAESETKATLEQKTRDLQSLINRRTTELKEYMRDAAAKGAMLEEAARERSEVEQKVRVLRESLEGVEKSIADHTATLARTDAALRGLRRRVEEPLRRDIALQDDRELNVQIVGSLVTLAQSSPNPAVAQRLVALLQQHNIESPRPLSARSDAPGIIPRSSSAASSARSNR